MRFVPCGALEGGLAYNWLDYQTSQGSCKEHERHPGFRQTQRDEIRGSFGATQWHHQLDPFRPYLNCGHGALTIRHLDRPKNLHPEESDR